MHIKYNSYNNQLSIVDDGALYSGVYICENIEEFVSYVSDRKSASYIIENGLESFKAELQALLSLFNRIQYNLN